MLRCALLLSFVSSLLGISSLYGQVLPTFAGESLAGKKFMMPGAVHGHPAVLVVCFTRNFGQRCNEWTKRLESEFKSNADPEIYTLIFLEEAPKMFRGAAKTGIRSGVAKEDYDHYLIVTEHVEEAKAVVHFQEPDDAYLIVLDPDGTIRWTSHGPVKEETVGKIRELMH